MGSLKVCIALFCLLFFQVEAIATGEADRTCPIEFLPCDDGECAIRGGWCDGEKNCLDDSDEAYCKRKNWYTGDDPNNCELTHFLCKNGQCIPLVGKCDGFEDCKDKSDEWDCEPETVYYGDHMLSTSTTMAPTETTSIESSSESNGLEDDGGTTTAQSSPLFFTQEANRTCPIDFMPCDDGECVSRGEWCDGETNCTDESDEAYCKRKNFWTGVDPNFCENTHFLCKNGQCIPLVGKCDGFVDCKDKSDESNCEPETVDYDDYMLSTITWVVPTETTSIKSSSERDGFENDDVATTMQSSFPFFTQGAAGHHSSHIQSPTSSYSPTRSYNYLPSTQSSSHLEGRRSPPFPSQTRPTFHRDQRRESHHPSTQSSISPSYLAVNQNQPISSFPKTRTEDYHQTQLIRPQESSRTISENQQRNRPTISSTLQQPFDARQQPYVDRQQPTESRQQPYDPRRNPDQYQSQSPGSNYYMNQPIDQVRKGDERENSNTSNEATPTETGDCSDHDSSPVQQGLRTQKRKTEKSEAEKRIESALNFLQIFAEKPEKDERSAFCELLCIQLREMDTDTRLLAMHEINNLIFRLIKVGHNAVDGYA